MKQTTDRFSYLLMTAAALGILLAAGQGRAQGPRHHLRRGDAVGREVQAAVQEVERARWRSARKAGALQAFARELDRTRSLLEDVFVASSRGSGEDESALLEASAERLADLFDQARARSGAPGSTRRNLGPLEQRFERLLGALDEIVRATTPRSRAELAGRLMSELESGPGGHHRARRRRLQPTIRLLPEDPVGGAPASRGGGSPRPDKDQTASRGGHSR